MSSELEVKLNELTFEGLKPGDILMFGAPQRSTLKQKITMLSQALFSRQKGHNNTTHVAIVTAASGVDGPAEIAHLTRYNMSYHREPLGEMMQRDGQFRPFHVYSAKDEDFALSIAKKALNVPTDTTISWSVKAAAGALFKNIHNSDQSSVQGYSSNNFCSKFVIETLYQAAQQQAEKYKPMIKTSSTPKGLEAYLESQTDKDKYSHSVWLSRNPLTGLNSTLELIEQRLRNKCTDSSLAKAKALMSARLYTISVLNEEPTLNDWEKTQRLFHAVSAPLNQNRSYFPWFKKSKTTSFKKAESYMNKVLSLRI